ncbi:MAG: hypothetical protein JOZ33_11310 [Acidobacteriaceae bacterium]|nr:hypothetical protein [Acidobacteriaceae bacterium]
MQRKLSLIAGMASTAALLLFFFHAVLAAETICWMVVLIPAMLFTCSLEDRKQIPVRSVARKRGRL